MPRSRQSTATTGAVTLRPSPLPESYTLRKLRHTIAMASGAAPVTGPGITRNTTMPSAEVGPPGPAIRIHAATAADVPALLGFVRELATYERLADQVVASEADLHAALFGPRPAAEAVLADLGESLAGFALFFQSYSTFLGRPGI